MPANPGYPPPLERCDVKFRNGTIARNVDPKSYRWRNDDPAYPQPSAGDIISWQITKGEK